MANPKQIIKNGDKKTPEEIIEFIQKYFPNAATTKIGTRDALAVLYATFLGESSGFATVQSGFFADSTVPGQQDPNQVRFKNRIGMAEPSFGLSQINADVHLSSIVNKMGLNASDPDIQKAINNQNFYDLDGATQLAVATWLSNPDNNMTMAAELYNTSKGINHWSAYKPNNPNWEIQYQVGLNLPAQIAGTLPTQPPPPPPRTTTPGGRKVKSYNQKSTFSPDPVIEKIYNDALKDPSILKKDTILGDVFAGFGYVGEDAKIKTPYTALVEFGSRLGKDEKTVFFDLVNTWLDMKPSREWEKLGKFIIDAPFLGVNKGKYEQFQDLNNMISQKLIDYDWAEAQAHYNREEGADELGRQVARIVGIGKNWLEKAGKNVGLWLENGFDNLTQNFDRDETAGFWDHFFDELGADYDTTEVISPEVAEFLNQSEEIDQSIKNAVAQIAGTAVTPDPETVYWARQGDSWITTTETDKPADAVWGWELDEFLGVDKSEFEESKYADFSALSADFPRLLSLATTTTPTTTTTTTPTTTTPTGTSSNFDTDGTNIVNIINEDGVPRRSALLSKGNSFRTAGDSVEYKELTDAGYVDIPYTDSLFTEFIEQEGLDWTPTIEVEVVDDEVVDDEVVDEEVTTAGTFEDTLELGTGYVANEVLNDWNNIPQGGILIDAGGQKFLGYQVPGAGQIYSEPPMYMLYQILNNDVYEAGLLTEGTPANVNVVLTSVADLNQYGLVVGGTDEITDDVEHPFIRFVENFEAGKKINPWLGDTRINPNSGVTYQQEAIEFLAEQAIEQWTPEETTVRVEASDWYQESTATQKQWLTKQLTQPVTAQQELDDKKIDIRTQMESLGMASPPDGLVDYFAEKSVTGMWSELYTTEQLALLADPYKPGARDTNLINFIEGVGFGSLDRASVMEKEVQDLYRTYLGPSLGNASATEISEKAGQLRNNPDAGGELKSYLEQQRLAMFPNYTNPTLRYNDIVQPYKNLVNQVWGEEADETSDWFIQMVQNNNIESAYQTLREKGIELGVERVQNQALQDLEDAIGEGSVQTDVGVNT